MYLNKKQIEAIDIALEALDYGLRCDVQQEQSSFAIDVLCEMKKKDREMKRKMNKNSIWKN